MPRTHQAHTRHTPGTCRAGTHHAYGMHTPCTHWPCTCDSAACALAHLWLTCMSQPAMRRRPVALVLVAPAVAHSAVVCYGRSSTLRCAAHPRGAAAQRGAEAGAAGACVSAAPAGVPRGQRAKINVVKVAGRGTPL